MKKRRLIKCLSSLALCSCAYANPPTFQNIDYVPDLISESDASSLHSRPSFGSWPWDWLSKKKKFEQSGSRKTPTPAPEKRDTSRRRRGSLSGGFLYWRSQQGGISYTNRAQSVLTTGNFTKSPLVGTHVEWNPGFELSASYGVCHSFWSFDLSFLQYQNDVSGHRTASNNNGFFPVLSFADTTLPSDYITSAKAHWHLSTSVLDATAMYREHCSSWFSLSPKIGFRDAWISQKVHADYSGGTFAAGSDSVRLKSGFYGIGPLFGILPKFTFGKVVSLYGDASISYLAGWFNIRQKETFLSELKASRHKDLFDWRWNAYLKGGLVLEKRFHRRCAGMKSVALDLGYDYFFFSQQNEFKHGPQFTLPSRGKSLILQGIHVALAAHF